MPRITVLALLGATLCWTGATCQAQSRSDRVVGVWDTGSKVKWEFRSDGTFRITPGNNSGTWKQTRGGIAIKYSGASVWLQLSFVGDKLVDQQGFVGRARLTRIDPPKRPVAPQVGKDALEDFDPDAIAMIAKLLGEEKKAEYEPQDFGDGKIRTQCNIFVQDFAEELLGDAPAELKGRLANEMYTELSKSKNWTPLGLPDAKDHSVIFEQAQELANDGKFVVVGFFNDHGPGHVAVVVPDAGAEMQSSPSWGNVSVPFIAQAGASVFSKEKFSSAFDPVSNSTVRKKTEFFVKRKR